MLKQIFKLFFFLISCVIIILIYFGFNLNSIQLNTIKLQINGTTTTTTNLSNFKNISIFCFIKTHPNNFKTRLPKSFSKCISLCSDYRYYFIII